MLRQNISSTELLSKMKLYDGTVIPYNYSDNIQHGEHPKTSQQVPRQMPSQKDIMKYFNQVMKNIAHNANNKQVCCMDFLINDIANNSLIQALTIEHVYNNGRLPGLVYCSYKTDSEIKNVIELFEMHDQIFLLKEDEVYKLHVTKENMHKLFLN